jgi:cytoskeletal protein RodZ
VSIGEALADARREAGLTVTEVSEQTRIRKTIITGIEAGDYSACGGDFYARGHIRSIAKAVGTDPEPLIREYDTARLGPPPGPEEITAPTPRVQEHRRRRRAGAVVLGLFVIVLLFLAAFRVIAGSGHATPAADPPSGPVTHPARHVTSAPATPAPTSAPAATPTPTPSATPAQALRPARAQAFGVQGPTQGDAAEPAGNAIDGSLATAWHTEWYTSAHFGNLYAGTGLLVDMGKTVTITAAQVTLGAARGANLQLRVGAAPTLSALAPVATAADAGGAVQLRPATPARGRYVLIWFTKLPPDPNGTFEAVVRDLRLEGS